MKILEAYGFSEWEARNLCQALNGVRFEPRIDDVRQYLLMSCHDTLIEPLSHIDLEIEAGSIKGEKVENRRQMADQRSTLNALIAKVEALSEAQARDVYCLISGFWAGRSIGAHGEEARAV